MADEDVDVVVIGSGAGGAPLTSVLISSGRQVLVLEKGPLLRTQYQAPDGVSDFKRDETFATGSEKRITIPGMATLGDTFYSSHVEPDLNDEPHVYEGDDGLDRATIEGYTAQVVGGGTQLYGGVSRGAAQAGVGGALPDSAGAQSDQRIPRRGHGRAGNAALPHAARGHHRRPRTEWTDGPRRPGQHQDRLREPVRRPARTEVQHLGVSLLSPLVGKPGFELRANCVVTHLEAGGAKVTRVHYRDPTGAARSVKARTVVVACSAIESARLLLLSGQQDPAFAQRANPNGLVGAYFLTHCFGGGQCVVPLPGRADKSKTLDSDWATDHCATPQFLEANGLWAGGAIYNNTSIPR